MFCKNREAGTYVYVAQGASRTGPLEPGALQNVVVCFFSYTAPLRSPCREWQPGTQDNLVLRTLRLDPLVADDIFAQENQILVKHDTDAVLVWRLNYTMKLYA